MTLQGLEKLEAEIKNKLSNFLRDKDLLSLSEHDFVHNKFIEKLKIVDRKICKANILKNGKNTAIEARQNQAARLQLTQGCTHVSLAAGLEVRIGSVCVGLQLLHSHTVLPMI